MFAPLANDTFLRAAMRQATPYTPVWLMRQAGRYLPEYLATRARAGSFMGLATSPDLATEVTLQPLDRFPLLDAAILFSDILTVPDAMGLGLSFAQGEGPRFARPVRDEAAVAALEVPDMARLQYVFEAVRSIRRALTLPDGRGRVPLIGFSGSPWTLACYMVEGQGSSDYHTIKPMLYSRPDLMHRILSVNAQAVAAYLNAQIDAGAQAVMIFDSWGGVLADVAFQQFSLDYIRQVLAGLKRTHDGTPTGHVIPRIVFTKGGGLWLPQMAKLDCDVLGLDWTVNLGAARHVVGATKALQGNLDPAILMATPQAVTNAAQAVLDQFGRPHTDASMLGSTQIFNLGHGISQFTPPEHVQTLLQTVRSHSSQQRVQAMTTNG